MSMQPHQTVIVTGASRGIGRAAALAFARRGANLLIHGTDRARLESLAAELRELGSAVAIETGDVADEDTARRAVARAETELGPPGVLVNNAGMNLRGPTLDMAIEDWRRVMAVNLDGTLHFCRTVLPGMIARGRGVILNVSSTTAKTPHRNAAPAYGASKAAVNYLTMHLAQEMAPHGIRVNAICPGPVETDMVSSWSEDYRAQVLARVPLGRLGRPEEIGEMIAFLASDAAGFITGETINVNGGTFMA